MDSTFLNRFRQRVNKTEGSRQKAEGGKHDAILYLPTARCLLPAAFRLLLSAFRLLNYNGRLPLAFFLTIERSLS
jgi:hypothetical protein